MIYCKTSEINITKKLEESVHLIWEFSANFIKVIVSRLLGKQFWKKNKNQLYPCLH